MSSTPSSSRQNPGARARSAPGFGRDHSDDWRASEIEIWLRDRLRKLPLYARLRSLTVQTTNRTDSGWTAEVSGEFTIPEQVQVKDLLAEFQRRFRLVERH